MSNPHLQHLLQLAELPAANAEAVEISGPDRILPTPWQFVGPGAACIAATGLAAAQLWQLKTGRMQSVSLSMHAAAAALRSPRYLTIDGNRPSEEPTSLTDFYQLKDQRWVYLHCNFPNVRDGNLSAVGAPADKAAVVKAIAKHDGPKLEAAMFDAGGCGGFIRNEHEWETLAQQKSVAQLPLFEIVQIGDAPPQPLPEGDRPLSGVRMLDLTRVLAGPSCAKAFAEHGADVLRVTRKDLPDLGPPQDVDTGIGKLQTHIDMRDAAQGQTMQELVRNCDVFLQGYRPGALAARGLSPQALAKIRPGIICTELSAWGHTGSWSGKRGYDTVVQAFNGMAWRPDNQRPVFLPASPHDYIAGYVLAFATMVALHRRATVGGSWLVRTSLAGAGEWLRSLGQLPPDEYQHLPAEFSDDVLAPLLMEHDSAWGRVGHLAPAVQLSETPGRWARPAAPRGSHPPQWPARA
ncbi:MAG: crotonobetainyl-CoA:carnitine CoA-transferase CaiB-like acyl-CoA transferase [Gammaproteobacteria bacterium]|jgi:crotonobetainyl-CoA:carnitine CoA-transferase CaiB-like acyl-CoA transferase